MATYEDLHAKPLVWRTYRPERMHARDFLRHTTAMVEVAGDRYPVHDLSLKGLSFTQPQGDGFPWEGGEMLPIVLWVGDALYYTGTAEFIREEFIGGRYRAAIEIRSGFLDLLAIKRLDEEQGLKQALAAGPESCRDPISAEFRAVVAQAVHFFTYYKGILDHHEARLRASGQRSWEAIESLTEQAYTSMVPRWLEINEHGHHVAQAFATDRRAMVAAKAFTEQMFTPHIRDVPIFHQSYTKPLGYPGDFRVMQYLYEFGYVGSSAFHMATHRTFCSEPLAHGVRERKDLLRDLAGEEYAHRCSANNQDAFKVTSLGCGPAKEVMEFIQQPRRWTLPVEWNLIDQEIQALNLAYEDSIREIAVRAVPVGITCLYQSFVQMMRDPDLAMLAEPQDLIYAAGLFDYLSDRRATEIITSLMGRVRPGGLLVVGNVAQGCPLFATEFGVDWTLKFRTQEQMAAWAGRLQDVDISFRDVPSGANHFLILRKRT